MTTLAKPPTQLVACGKDFHREILATMSSPELFTRACLSRNRNVEAVAWRFVSACFLRSGTMMSGPEIGWVTGAKNHSTVFTHLRNAKPIGEWGVAATELYDLWTNACELRRWPHGSPVEDWRWVMAMEDMKK